MSKRELKELLDSSIEEAEEHVKQVERDKNPANHPGNAVTAHKKQLIETMDEIKEVGWRNVTTAHLTSVMVTQPAVVFLRGSQMLCNSRI